MATLREEMQEEYDEYVAEHNRKLEAKEEKELSKHKAAINSGEEEYGATEEEKDSEEEEEDESLGELLTLDEFIEK